MSSGIHNHTQLPARPDLIRLIIGIFGIGSSGPLIALSAMPVPTLIFWRNLGGSLVTLPFALRHKVNRTGVRWAVLAGVVLAVHFVGFFLAMRLTSVTAGTAIVATQPIFAAFFVKLTGGHIPKKAWLGMLISFSGVLVVTGIDLQLDRKSFLGDINFDAKEWWILLGLILGAQILGHTMFNLTLKRVSPAVVSMIVFFEVPVAALLSFIFKIGKEPTLSIIPGVILILTGCILVVLRTKEAQ